MRRGSYLACCMALMATCARSGAAEPNATSAADPIVAILSVDGTPVSSLRQSDFAIGAELLAFVPSAVRSEWQLVQAWSETQLAWAIRKEGATGLSIRLFLHETGPSVGAFLPPGLLGRPEELIRPRSSGRNITEIRIFTRERRTQQDLVISVDGQRTVLAADVFAAMPLLEHPEGRRRAGVPLARVARAVGVFPRDIDRVRLIDQSGRSLAVGKIDFSRAGLLSWLKRNRQGRLRFEEWDVSRATPRRSRQMSSVVRVELDTSRGRPHGRPQ